MKKIHLYLCGGLGNQLFEYAAARNLAIKNNSKLIIDVNSGFITDFRDPTKFSLKNNNLQDTKLLRFNFFFLIYRFLKKFGNFDKFLERYLNINVIDETNHSQFDEKILNVDFNKKIYLIGYFQSNLYFKENEDKILQEIYPQKPLKVDYLNLKEEVSKPNSVCIGVRMHENIEKKFGLKISEKSKNKIINQIGGITSSNFYVQAIEKMKKKINDPKFFIFSTKNSNIKKIIDQSDILKKHHVKFITAENGYEDAYDNLWLMSQFKNFIISNSTLYWWGAYFSKKKYKKNYVLCSSNFPNKDTCLKEWKVI